MYTCDGESEKHLLRLLVAPFETQNINISKQHRPTNDDGGGSVLVQH